MPTPWLSWPNTLASTRWSATSCASWSELPSARQIARVKACNRSGLILTSPTELLPSAMPSSPPGFRFRRATFRVGAALSTDAEKPQKSAQIWPPEGGKTDLRPRGKPGLKNEACVRFPIRLAWLLLLLVTAVGPTMAQTAPPPQRPFGQLVELWTRQLDRIPTRAERANLLPVEIDTLREQVAGVPAAASAAANLARNDRADTRRLLAPLE